MNRPVASDRERLVRCAPNFRDMGGRPTRCGSMVRRGLLYRSEAISAPEAADADRLAALGVRLVCDLRGGSEREAAPNHFWRTAGAEVWEVDVAADIRASGNFQAMLRSNPGVEGARRMMLQTYRALPMACKPHLGVLFDRLIEGACPVVIHCTAGKDRTGFLAAMILHALGVPEEHVMADYLESGQRANPAVTAATRAILDQIVGRPVSEEALAALTQVDPAYLGASLEVIRAGHGSVEAYLRDAGGLSEARRDLLRRALLA